jgi:hypothetical protein
MLMKKVSPRHAGAVLLLAALAIAVCVRVDS